MELRKATEKDAQQIALVLKKSYNINSIEEGSNAFLVELEKGINYIVADINGKIIGLVSYFFHGLPKHELIELDRIAVLSEFKGQDIARQLFKALVRDANKKLSESNKRLRKVFLLTHESNVIAHKFYEKIGMTYETTLKDHFYKGKDERVYSMFF